MQIQAGVFFQTLQDYPFQLRRKSRIQRARRHRRAIQNGVGKPRSHRFGKRLPCGGQLVKYSAQRKNVAARIHRLIAQLLRRHVGQRPGNSLRFAPSQCRRCACRRPQQLGQAEVQHLDAPFRRHHHVARLQVAMDDAALMRLFQRIGDLQSQRDGFLFRHRAAARPLRQRLARHVFHGDQLHARFAVKIKIKNGRDVGMVQLGKRQRLFAKTLARRLIGQRSAADDLQRHLALQPLIVRRVHLAHASGA